MPKKYARELTTEKSGAGFSVDYAFWVCSDAGMPALQPLDIDREAVRVLVVAIGVRPAARELGLSEDTVAAWSARGGWLAHTREKPVLPATMEPVASGASKSPADALADVMSDLDRRSKLGFAKASAKVAEDAADKPVAALIEDAQAINTWAKTASLAHGWAGSAGATVNVAVALRLDMDW